MSDKNFKIKPKVWPKEYTFEEYKQLNPNITENLLINYYNKYLQEYAEDRSRHIKHFNGTKENLSKELNLLNEKLINNITDNPDRDLTIGPTGAGRLYHKALPTDVKSVYFDGIDDIVHLDENNPIAYSGSGSPLRPLNAYTVAVWYKNPVGYQDQSAPYYRIFSCYYGGGYHMTLFNTKIECIVSVDDGDGTKTNLSATNVGTHIFETSEVPGTDTNVVDNGVDTYPRVYGHPSKNGWHFIVSTFDNKVGNPAADGTYTASLKLYVDGEIANKKHNLASPIIDTSNFGYGDATDEIYGSTGLNVSGAKGTIFYDGQDGVEEGRVKWAPGIGNLPTFLGNSGTINGQASDNATQSIAETAMWDVALDANAIKDLYDGVVLSSKGARYDLAYEGHSTKGYDVLDEGLDYTNVGKYVDNLQLWYQFEDAVSSSRALDSSGKGHHGVYKNLPFISGSSYTTYPGG